MTLLGKFDIELNFGGVDQFLEKGAQNARFMPFGPRWCQNPVLEHYMAKLNMILNFFFFMRRVMYTHHACFIHLNPSWCQGLWCLTRYAFQKVLTFLLTQWPGHSCCKNSNSLVLFASSLTFHLSQCYKCHGQFKCSNVLNWVEVRWLGRSRQFISYP